MSVQPQSEANCECAAASILLGNSEDKLLQSNKTWPLSQQSFTLFEGLANQRKFPMLKIPKAAMNYASRATGGPRCEVMLLEQHGALSCPRTFPRNGNPVDAAADYDDIEMLGRDRLSCWTSKIH